MISSHQRHTAGRVARVFVLVLFALGVVPRANAALLGLTSGLPDIQAGPISVVFNASLDTFVASGITMSLDYPGGANPDYLIRAGSNSFRIEATINDSGVATGGTLTIKGAVPGKFSDPNTVLLTGTLVANGFGADSSSGNFEFRFGNLGGELKDDFNKIGTVGVKLNSGKIGFDSHFNFSNNGFAPSARADVYAEVPEPGTMLLWSSLGVGLLISRRRLAGRTG